MVAIRNGIDDREAFSYFNKIMRREVYINLARKIGIENLLRKLMKKQKKTKMKKDWYLQ